MVAVSALHTYVLGKLLLVCDLETTYSFSRFTLVLSKMELQFKMYISVPRTKTA
jgi:hypothetical protein